MTDQAAAAEATEGYCPACGRGDCALTADQYEQRRVQSEEWRRKAISRALTISRLRGTIDALIDLAGEKITDPGPRGAGYSEAIGDLREVLREYGHLDGETTATEPTQRARTSEAQMEREIAGRIAITDVACGEEPS